MIYVLPHIQVNFIIISAIGKYWINHSRSMTLINTARKRDRTYIFEKIKKY